MCHYTHMYMCGLAITHTRQSLSHTCKLVMHHCTCIHMQVYTCISIILPISNKSLYYIAKLFALFFLVSFLFPEPTLTVSPDSITVTEGEVVTLSCTPDDPRVRVEWYYLSQPDFPTEPIFPSRIFPSSNDVIFDDQDFQHQLTITITRSSQGQYLCYPQGLDSLELFASPGTITINVLECQSIASLGQPITLVLSYRISYYSTWATPNGIHVHVVTVVLLALKF